MSARLGTDFAHYTKILREGLALYANAVIKIGNGQKNHNNQGQGRW